jgi:hypothetical protein
MQKMELNCAINGVENTTDISGRPTAGETNRGLRTGNGRNFWLIACSTFLGSSLTMAALFGALAPMPTMAGEEERGRQGEDERTGHKEIEALEAKVASLQATVSALQTQVNTLQTHLASVQSNTALKLGPFINVVSGLVDGVNGPHIYFTGANIHIVSGSGSTGDNGTPRGLGNLIIGYDEDPKNYVDSSPGGELPLSPGDRGGSHNLVIGAANRFTQAAFGGLVVGTANTIEGYGESVSGGLRNTASGAFASVSGGGFNTAFQIYTSVSGGAGNTAGGTCSATCGAGASVSGGSGNIASGNFASVSGGEGNIASDYSTSVSGGPGNTAGGRNTVVIGGQNVIDYIDFTIQPKAPFP